MMAIQFIHINFKKLKVSYGELYLHDIEIGFGIWVRTVFRSIPRRIVLIQKFSFSAASGSFEQFAYDA